MDSQVENLWKHKQVNSIIFAMKLFGVSPVTYKNYNLHMACAKSGVWFGERKIVNG